VAGCRIEILGSWFGVQGLGFRVQGSTSGFRISHTNYSVYGLGFRVE
jgi:hypothetical protein